MIHLGPKFQVDPARLVDTRLLIQANSGGGKSFALRRLAEQTKLHTIILDPEGEFVTLREKLDYPVVGQGEGCELPAKVKTAALLARNLMELHINAVVDLFGLPLTERRAFVAQFCTAMLNLPKDLWRPVLIILDEAHAYCPERSHGESVATEPVVNLMAQGRKRGMCGILATQRLSKLHKDAAAECNNVLIGRTTLDVDQKRAGEILGSNKLNAELRDMAPGHFFAFGPAFNFNGVEKVQIGEVQTTHPKAGQRHKLSAPAPSKLIQAHLAKFTEMEQKAEVEVKNMEDAKKRIRELELQLRADLENIRVLCERLKLQGPNKTTQIPKAAPVPEYAVTNLVPGRLKPLTQPLQADGQNLSDSELKILKSIAWLNSIGNMSPVRAAVASLSGYTVTGGRFVNLCGSLRSKCLIQYHGEVLDLTTEGRVRAPRIDEALSTAQMHAKVMSVLDPSEQKVLKIILDNYPNAVLKADVATAAGYEPTGGRFVNICGSLRSKGLIDYPSAGQLQAKSYLFID